MYYVYVLYSDLHKRTYTGMTTDVQRRLSEHNNRQNKSTKTYVPWIIIYTVELESRIEARRKEKYLKSGVGREFIKSLLVLRK